MLILPSKPSLDSLTAMWQFHLLPDLNRESTVGPISIGCFLSPLS